VNLNVLWFVLIAMLFIGYFFLEGFDFGVGMLLPFVGRTDQERRAVIATIGPVWDANEVWLITAGGSMFAAFPNWYATLFSGFYLALAVLLMGLVLRGVGLEMRSRRPGASWRRIWDGVIAASSFVVPLIWGVAMANLLAGVPIDAHMNYVGGFFNLLGPFAIVGGLTAVFLFALHGALYLTLKTEGEVMERARRLVMSTGAVATALFMVFFIAAYFYTPIVERLGVDPGMVPLLAILTIISVRFLTLRGAFGWAFAMNGVGIVLAVASVFLILFPDVIPSSLNPAFSLTIYNAASNAYSLRVMTIVAVSVLPFVLAYQAWTYWVFRRRVSLNDTFHY